MDLHKVIYSLKTLLSLSLTTLIANTASAYTIPRNADSFGQLVEFAVNAVKNDVQFDSICSSYKCEPTTTWRYGYKAYIYNNLVDLYFDLTGHLVEVRITDIPIDISRKVNSSLHKISAVQIENVHQQVREASRQ